MNLSCIRSATLAIVLLPVAAHAAEPESPAKPGPLIKPVEPAAGSAEGSRTRGDLMALSTALKLYQINSGDFPTDRQGIEALAERPQPPPNKWTKLVDKVPVDPWGREYRLFTRRRDGKIERVIGSRGPDVKSDQDDIEQILESILKPE